ncbi:MAG: hypothetical protein KJ847_02525 [Firmicutes bacterium]|nr:hypothetical protein [Bacillota bacterium]
MKEKLSKINIDSDSLDYLSYKNVKHGTFPREYFSSYKSYFLYKNLINIILILVALNFSIIPLFSYLGILAKYRYIIFICFLFNFIIIFIVIRIVRLYYLKIFCRILNEDYYFFREEYLIKKWDGPIKLKFKVNEMRDHFNNMKTLKDGTITKKRSWPYSMMGGVWFPFNFSFIFCFDKIPPIDKLLLQAKRKTVNIVICYKVIDGIDLNEFDKKKLLDGYQIVEADNIKFRVGYIYLDQKNDTMIHRPRTILLYPDELFLGKYKQLQKEAVVIDYSEEIYQYINNKSVNFMKKC